MATKMQNSINANGFIVENASKQQHVLRVWQVTKDVENSGPNFKEKRDEDNLQNRRMGNTEKSTTICLHRN
jgi:hypothetical protein